MSTPPAGIPEADWLSWPPEARQFILAQQQEIEQLRSKLTALATELASLREQIGRVNEVVEHHPDACRRCGSLLHGEDPDPLRHQVIEIPPITPLVIEHRLHPLVCPCCSTCTCAPLPADVDVSRYGPRLSSLIALLGPCSSSRWSMSTKPAPPPAMPTAAIPPASAAGCGWRCLRL